MNLLTGRSQAIVHRVERLDDKLVIHKKRVLGEILVSELMDVIQSSVFLPNFLSCLKHPLANMIQMSVLLRETGECLACEIPNWILLNTS